MLDIAVLARATEPDRVDMATSVVTETVTVNK